MVRVRTFEWREFVYLIRQPPDQRIGTVSWDSKTGNLLGLLR